MRRDAKANDVIRAVSLAIEAKFDRGDWLDLALMTDTTSEIKGHPRLLRSLEWGDEDYHGHVIDMVPVALGRHRSRPIRSGVEAGDVFPNLTEVEDYLSLQPWLEKHHPKLFEALYAGEDETALDELEAAAAELGLPDVDEHAARIRRGLRDDPAQAIGSSKELLETVLKAVLGLHGTGPETKIDLPKLVKKANLELGLDAAEVPDDDPAAKHRRRLLGGLSSIVIGASELRNAGFGTGHGVSRRPSLDVATARLVVSAAVTVATFYIEAHAASHGRQ